MRRSLLALLVFVSIGICATGVHAAQTDCQRWWTEYREAMSHTPAVHRIRHVRHRVHHAAKKRLVALVHPRPHPAPKVLPARQRLHPTRKEIRHAFDFACGELPETDDAELLDLGRPEDFISDLDLPGQPIDAIASTTGPIALNELPQYPGTGGTLPPGIATPPVFAPVINPGGALPGVPTQPGVPTLPGSPSTPGTPVAPESPVPEPGSIALVLTGVLGAMGTVRRRFR